MNPIQKFPSARRNNAHMSFPISVLMLTLAFAAGWFMCWRKYEPLSHANPSKADTAGYVSRVLPFPKTRPVKTVSNGEDVVTQPVYLTNSNPPQIIRTVTSEEVKDFLDLDWSVDVNLLGATYKDTLPLLGKEKMSSREAKTEAKVVKKMTVKLNAGEKITTRFLVMNPTIWPEISTGNPHEVILMLGFNAADNQEAIMAWASLLFEPGKEPVLTERDMNPNRRPPPSGSGEEK